MKYLIALMLPLFLASACKKDDNKQSELDDQIIRDYITLQGWIATKTASGLYYVIDQPGNSQHPTLNNDVRVTYSGYYSDGIEFDGNTLTFALSGVIAGWREGIPYFGKGGQGKLLIPSALGYGDQPPAGIRSNAVLIFDIHLIDIK